MSGLQRARFHAYTATAHGFLSVALGSVGALELVDHLIETYKGKPLEAFFKSLLKDIEADQDTLQAVIETLGQKESAVRKAGAWRNGLHAA